MDLCRRSGKSPLPFFSTPPPLDYPNFLGFGSNCSNGTADWVVYYIELCIKFLSTQIVSDVSYRVLKIVQSTLFDKKFSCNLESTSDLVPKLQSLDYCLWVNQVLDQRLSKVYLAWFCWVICVSTMLIISSLHLPSMSETETFQVDYWYCNLNNIELISAEGFV